LWQSVGADICWEGVASDVNDHCTLSAGPTMVTPLEVHNGEMESGKGKIKKAREIEKGYN
jgi:hypothetical protein